MPEAMARLYHPCHVKAAMRIEQPLQWKASFLASLWKGIGSTALLINHRDIHIAPTDGKQFGANTRHGLIGPLGTIAGASQYGAGLNCAACDAAHLHVAEALIQGVQAKL